MIRTKKENSEYQKKWRENNIQYKEYQKEYQKKYKKSEKYRTYQMEYSREWRKRNSEKIREYNKKWRKENKERMKKIWKKYSEKSKEKRAEYSKTEEFKITQGRYRKTEKFLENNKKWKKERLKIPQIKIEKLLRTRLWKALRGNKKAGSVIRDLGCTLDELKIHLENQFTEGMTWDNHSLNGWHIDHIYPLSKVDLTNREQFLKACHYTNLQPLWATDNHKKSNKLLADKK